MDLIAYLKEKNIWFKIFEKEITIHTADAAASAGFPIERVTKSLVFIADSKPIMLIIPGNCRVNKSKLKILLDAKNIEIVPFENAEKYSGYEPGATPPVCHKKIDKVIIDEKLLDYETVYGGGGSKNKLIELKVKDIIDLNKALTADITEVINMPKKDSKTNLDTLRHSAAHILAQAIKEIYPKVKFGIGPAIENGFYYDFDNLEIKEEDFEKIEKKIKEIIKNDLKFIKKEISEEEAKELFKDEPYKLELINDLIEEGKKISAYCTGDKFVDLCSGPHIKSTGQVKAFKLMKITGAFWKGSEKNKMLTRIYGTAFESEGELKHYLHTLEEAERRSHRKIGKQLDLFSIHEDTGPGLPLFHPKGTVLFNLLRDFWEEQHKKAGYVFVNTPHVFKLDLWKKSGHWDNYRDHMFITKYGEDDYGVKPMNCPGHLYIYNSSAKSYRDLPIRMGEMGVVYRCEITGTLTGLFRVVKITQDDAHIFCREDQVEEELKGVIDLTFQIYKDFGFKDIHIELSTKPEKHIGSDKIWELAEATLEKVLKDKKINYKINPGDGAFYGPKIDFHIKDALGRTWQCGTLQLDFAMPEKFSLKYAGQDNKEHQPVMLHRTIYGSLERFIGILIEHFAGAFPVWLAPVQIKIISFTDDFVEYAKEIENKIKEAGLRIEGDYRDETVQKKVRDAELEKVPFILVVGKKEKDAGTVAVRERGNPKIKFGVNPEDFIKDVKKKVEKKE